MSIAAIEGLRNDVVFWDTRDQLKTHIYRRSNACFDAGDAARDRILDPAALRRRQEEMRSVFIAAFGGLPPSDTSLDAEVRGAIEEEGLRIERVVFQPRPRMYVTANLYLPAGLTRPTGAVLFLSGHFPEARLSDEYQVVCRVLAQAGLVVLAQDPVGQGERWSYWEPVAAAATVACGTTEHEYAGSQSLLLGDGIARYFLHDAMRGIDYLRSRPEVDPEHIGVTGNSGGGTQTSLMMVCDPRIAAAVPGTFIMNRRTYQAVGQAQDAEQIWRGMTAVGFDHEDILLAMAPRPVLVLAVTHDFFPIEGTRSTVERCRRLWEIAGAKGNLEMFEDPIEHHYSARMAAKAAEFFSRHLNGKPVAVDASGIRTLPQRDLRCTSSGQVRGEIPGARAVFEENVDRLEAIEATRRGLADGARRTEAERWLRAKVFLDRTPCPPNTRHLREWFRDLELGLACRLAYWWSQEGLMGGGILLRDHNRAGERLPLSIGVWWHGTGETGRHLEWIRAACATGRAVLVLDVSGSGMLETNLVNGGPRFGYFGTMFKFAHDLVWLDDSLPALRTWELLRTLDVAEATFDDVDPADVEVHAFGWFSVYAELAAFLDPRIRRVRVEQGLESFASLVRSRYYVDTDIGSVILPDALQHFDLPDLRRWRS